MGSGCSILFGDADFIACEDIFYFILKMYVRITCSKDRYQFKRLG
jgi:hypothetical protein